MTTPYADYDVLKKWRSPSYNAITREVLTRRMEAVCARLIPQPERTESVAIAPFVDADLHKGVSEGFRHPDMPQADETWRKGLDGIDAAARHRYGRAFAELDPDSQDATLTAIQKGEADASFDCVPAKPFFEQVLLKAVVGVYYSHPDAWSEMGFGGPASPRGYVRMGLDEHDPWEAPLKPPLVPPPGGSR